MKDIGKENAAEVFIENMAWMKNPANPAFGWFGITPRFSCHEDHRLFKVSFLDLEEVWKKGIYSSINRKKAYPQIDERLEALFAAVDILEDIEDTLTSEQTRRILAAIR